MKKLKILVVVLFVIVLLESIVILSFIFRPTKHAAKKIYRQQKPKIAIVIDDWGYHLDNLALIQNLKYPITASILPNLAYSRNVAAELHALGFEIILHLPMEPNEKYNLEEGTILTSMGTAQVDRILDKAITGIPYLKGVSNHMGSKATADRKLMQAVFQNLKKRRLYFLDSFVSPKSISFSLAREMHLKTARRDIFLDNNSDTEYIKGQISKLKTKARISGFAIGIGHDRKSTFMVLKEVLPQLAAEGYKIVPLSDLVN